MGSQAQHTHSLEDHTRSIQQSTSTHTQHIHKIQQQNNNYTQNIANYSPLHSTQVQEVIKQSKNNSQGPNKLNIRHLKHIDSLGLAFLTSMFETALNKNILPHIWKLVNIVHIQNPTKT